MKKGTKIKIVNIQTSGDLFEGIINGSEWEVLEVGERMKRPGEKKGSLSAWILGLHGRVLLLPWEFQVAKTNVPG
jgi:hypothetical protein